MATRDALRQLAKTFAPIQPRRALVALGARLSPRAITRVTQAIGGLEQGRWFADQGWHVENLPDRFAVFEEAVRRVVSAAPLYLEFGVYRGRSMRYWVEHLSMPAARFVGFDSFEGLPEDWNPNAQEGTFSVGRPPEIDDPRVSFVVGWFDETLPTWTLPGHSQLVVNLDCDLYSSTRGVLEWLTPHLRPGDLVYFDDLLTRDHQWRAMTEWLGSAPEPAGAARPVAMARWGHHMLFEVPSR